MIFINPVIKQNIENIIIDGPTINPKAISKP
jgi:hypothetical protein